MNDDNQASPPAPMPLPPRADRAEPALESLAPASTDGVEPTARAAETARELAADVAGDASAAPAPLEFDSGPSANLGLTVWFAMLAAFGIGGLLLHQQELAGLAALAGLFAASQAADVDRQWSMLYALVSWVVPVAGVSAFVTLGIMLRTAPLPHSWGSVLVGLCWGSAAASALTFFRPFSRALTSGLFHTRHTSHTLRLAARIVFLCFLFAIPGWFAIRKAFDSMDDQVGSLVESASLGTGLVGYLVLALASVGFLLRRNGREALARLGIGPVSPSHALVILTGVVGLYALNGTADWAQRTYFHSLWIDDQRMSEAIGGKLGIGGTVVLGLSAGIGEEITLRGALQPRLGLIGTSLLFASLHVQYSWYGIGVIFLLGLVLGTIRNRTNTTVAMAVHALYDMAAVFAIGGHK